mgnify:CR=1 FL=1
MTEMEASLCEAMVTQIMVACLLACLPIDDTYRTQFILRVVLKVFEEVTPCLVLFEGDLDHFCLGAVLFYAATPRTVPS